MGELDSMAPTFSAWAPALLGRRNVGEGVTNLTGFS